MAREELIKRLAEEFSKKFPGIDRDSHLAIIRGAIGGKNPTWEVEGFKEWYEEVGRGLEREEDLVDEILRDPHFAMYREGMILRENWMGESIQYKVRRI